MELLSWVYVIAAVVLLFGASVFVHEFGHFWVARRRGLKVEEFSIGFGPKIFGWMRDGVAYSWRWIPAGGYVKLPQMVTAESLEGETQEQEPLPPASPGSKILVALAGPVMNVVFAFVIASAIYFLGLPRPANPAVIGMVPPDSPAAKLGIRAGDRIVAVDGKPVKTWQEVQQTTALALTNVLPVTIQRDGTRTTYHLPAIVNQELDVKVLELEPSGRPSIASVSRDGAGAEAGLKKGDEVISFAGIPIADQQQLIDLIRKRPEKTTPMEIQRGSERLKLTVTPQAVPGANTGILGVMLIPNSTVIYQVERPGPLPWTMVGQVCQQTFGTLAALFHGKRSGVGVGDLSGPPGILAMLAAEVKTDYRLALKFMVLLNISLAILNLLPIPVLDGGHITLSIFEKVRGRPLNPRIQGALTTGFAVLLISFMLYVSFNDVFRRFSLYKSMFNQPVEIESGNGASNSVPSPK